MFPLMLPSLITAIAGFGLQAYGLSRQVAAAKVKAQLEQNIANDEYKAEGVRFQAMSTDARRRELEVIRNAQRARAMAVTTATSQGAAQGSGLQGAYGQISGQSETNMKAIGDSLNFGTQMFAINADISAQRGALAHNSADAAEAQGYSSLGSSLMSVSSLFSKFA